MTAQMSSDIVDLVSKVIFGCGDVRTEAQADYVAGRVVEATHHAELVEALLSARRTFERLTLIYSELSTLRLQADAEIGAIDEALAKVGDHVCPECGCVDCACEREGEECGVPGCRTRTDRGICESCDKWVTEQTGKIGGDA